jgi:hypothetical protein
MDAPTSFNELFFAAKTSFLRLNSFHQLSDGLFVANWRGEETGPFEAVTHERPFDALRDSFMLAMRRHVKRPEEAGSFF